MGRDLGLILSGKTKISVIVPFYKVEKYLERCLESILSQTFKDFELILIDDCGGDSSLEIAQKYSRNDSRIRLIQNEKNSGQGYSRNKGIELSKGEYIIFIDSDDWVEPKMFEILHEKARNTATDIVKCDYSLYWPNLTDKYNISKICPDFDKIYNIFDDVDTFLGFQIISVWNCIFKTEFIRNKKLKFDEVNKFEDILFMWEAFIHSSNFAFVEDALYNYNKTNESSDTSHNHYLVKYITKDAELLKEIVINDKRLFSAFTLFVFILFNYIYPKATFMEKQKLKKKFKQILNGIDTSGSSEIISRGLATKSLNLFLNNDYSYIEQSLIEKVAKTIRYSAF